MELRYPWNYMELTQVWVREEKWVFLGGGVLHGKKVGFGVHGVVWG
jgi:hypothetical protein